MLSTTGFLQLFPLLCSSFPMMARIIEDNVLRHHPHPICPICKIGVWVIGSRRTSNTDLLCGYGYLKAMPLPREQRNSPRIPLAILESPAGCCYPAWKPFLLTHVGFTWPLEQLLNDVSLSDRESASADTMSSSVLPNSIL